MENTRPPTYDELRETCRTTPGQIFIPDDVLTEAALEFHWQTREAVLAAIAKDRLKDVTFIKSVPLKLNFTGVTVKTAEYSFRVGRKAGYIAFHWSKIQRIKIKSIHKSIDEQYKRFALERGSQSDADADEDEDNESET